tara:strand:- start:1565 stop:2152 length:588 start_codon:yes stop_codon:yes gene_type:complete
VKTRSKIWPWLVAMVAVVTAGLWWVKPDAVEVPRPLGQIRITLPDTTTSPYKTPCGSQFRIPNHAKVELRNSGDKEGCWFNLSFPRFNAKLHCTEVPVRDLESLLRDAQSLVFGHEVAATGIRRQALDLPSKSGTLYALEGPVATPLQFFVTDSTDHFIRGSLYFSHKPNPDSVAPVLQRLESDVRIMMETLLWP